ncbi:hypothetical protein HJC23_013393 [Cyclotella cryptica]|uniref:SAP domain-containing protein n=1 Tax=Cyclotella cryptica TaxID=29204 RepID=A0ABD3PWZ6_9STRA|eukprot:CCRYP_010956-RA/>CCRYP_010956-RA protein AED:0.05 eAED:-0.06 QI:0/-1/0/1/-1/1/1/0/1547
MTSAGPSAPSKTKLSPSSRQDILTQRLLLTLEKDQPCSSRKRPYPFAAPSSSFVQIDAFETGSPLTPIDLSATWKEISSIFPMLSYSEESNQLFLALLGIASEEDQVDNEVMMKAFDSALQDMLWVRTNARAQHRQDVLTATSVEAEQNIACKKQRMEFSQSSSKASHNKLTDARECEVLPWNVLLRVTLRFAACVAKKIQPTRSVEDNTLPNVKNSSFKKSVEPSVIPATVHSDSAIGTTGSIAGFAAGNTSATEPSADVTTMHVNDIRRELKKCGLGTKGKKVELAERLKRHLKEVRAKQDHGVVGGEVDETNSDVAIETAEKNSCMVVSRTATADGKNTNALVESKTATSSQTSLGFQSSTNNNAAKDESESDLKRIHPIIRSLDIALSELSIILKTEQKRRLVDSRRRQQSLSSTVFKSEGKDAESSINEIGSVTKSALENFTQQSSISQDSTSTMLMVKDRMICDWINRSRCGPSRYAFMKDVNFVARSLDLKILNVSVEEWQEKMHTIVGYLDEYVGLRYNDSVPVIDKSSIVRSPLSSPIARSPLASTFLRSPLSSNPFKKFSTAPGSSLAEIACAHVKRSIDMGKETERHAATSPTKSGGFSLNSGNPRPDPCDRFNSKSSTMHMRPVESTEEDVDQLEDAYRMALAVARKSGELQREGTSERIKRRLELLLQQINVPKEKKPNGNVDGAESYLRLLLRELILPSDPTVWARLMKESEEKEISMLLRRGRSILVSFLIEVRAPGWEDACSSLDPSPLADYLGFLSGRDDATTLPQEHDEVFTRSCFLLPSAHDNAASLPSPPIVTEIGLGACVSNFVQKECDVFTSGVRFVFNRKAGPESLAKRDPFLESIAIPLPDVGELTRDLFDLTLRLAADDDAEHENKPFPLRLATPSATDSLNIVLDVVSDHSQWLEPRAVSERYKCVIEMILLSFGGFAGQKSPIRSGGKHKKSWEMRASSLITIAKTVQNRARIAVYATHFMMILCSKKAHPIECTFGSRPSFYNVLQLHKFSQFWNEVEEAAQGNAMGIMAQVFDEAFCTNHLLPLSHHCSMLLAKVAHPPSVVGHRSPVGNHEESALSLITILCSVFSLLAEDDLLVDCIHVGWSMEVLSLSIRFFILCEKLTSTHPLPARNSLWGQVLDRLRNLFKDVWGDLRSDFWAGKNQSALLSPKPMSFVCIESKNGSVRTMSLMPSFDTLVASLVNFSSNANLNESVETGTCWSKFVSAFLLDQYAQVLPFNALASSWIRSLASTLTREVNRQNALDRRKCSRKKSNPEDDVSTELILNRLMNPLLKSLHSTILMQHARRTSSLLKTCTDMVAFTYAELFKEESARILTKPSPLKTRTWHVYRSCIEKMFISTPPSALFTSLGHSFLTESSAAALHDVWEHYGESHCVHIMVAAGLHVHESVSRLQYSNEQGISANFKALYEAFTSQSKECITSTFGCFALSSRSSLDTLELDYYEFAHCVRRDLTSNSAEAGVMWWNELNCGLSSLLAGAKKRTMTDGQCVTRTKPVSDRRRSIAHVFASLEQNLSAISNST